MAETLSTPPTILLVIVAYVVLFPLFWMGVVGLIGRVGGWQRLAQRYRATFPPAGQRWNWQYGTINWANYNGALVLTANDLGLFIETMWLFKFGHPRLFIPWGEFRDAEVGSYFLRRQVRAQVGFPTIATVRLPAAVFEESTGQRVLVNRRG